MAKGAQCCIHIVVVAGSEGVVRGWGYGHIVLEGFYKTEGAGGGAATMALSMMFYIAHTLGKGLLSCAHFSVC